MIPLNILQSMVARNRTEINMLECVARSDKLARDELTKAGMEVSAEGFHKDYLKEKRTIKKLAKIQRALKQEICEQINEQRFGGMFHFDRKED